MLWTRCRSLAAGYAGRPYGDGPGEVNCSTLYAGILMALYPELAGDYARLVLADHSRPWDDLDVLVARGVGTRVVSPPSSPGVYAAQRWRDASAPAGGHAWLAQLRVDDQWERIDADRRPHGALRVERLLWAAMTLGAETRCVRLIPPRRLGGGLSVTEVV